jgi:hypothetical protein
VLDPLGISGGGVGVEADEPSLDIDLGPNRLATLGQTCSLSVARRPQDNPRATFDERAQRAPGCLGANPLVAAKGCQKAGRLGHRAGFGLVLVSATLVERQGVADGQCDGETLVQQLGEWVVMKRACNPEPFLAAPLAQGGAGAAATVPVLSDQR